MLDRLVFALAALAALVPAAVLPIRRPTAGRDPIFWALVVAAVAGPAAYTLVQIKGSWNAGLSLALWASIAASVGLFALLAAVMREAWRLTPLLLPYLFVLGVLATLSGAVTPSHPIPVVPEGWLFIHIGVSVATYALATLAAIAGLAVVIQERALKRKRPGAFTDLLPSIADGERLQLRFLGMAELVLGAGLVTGMALEYLERGVPLIFDHKTVLSLLTFALIGLLLYLNRRFGIRGRQAGRLVLLAYLLLTLAYPGVKFVSDVLLG